MKDIKLSLYNLKIEIEQDIRSLLELEKGVSSEISAYSSSIKKQFVENINRSKSIRLSLSKRLATIDQLEMELKLIKISKREKDEAD